MGVFPVKQRLSDEVASKVVALGVRSFQRPMAQYPHSIVVIGAGLGGMQTMIGLLNSGRKERCFEWTSKSLRTSSASRSCPRLVDILGWFLVSFIHFILLNFKAFLRAVASREVVSNKYTKLQTESGNYHVDYMFPDMPATSEVEGDPYKPLV